MTPTPSDHASGRALLLARLAALARNGEGLTRDWLDAHGPAFYGDDWPGLVDRLVAEGLVVAEDVLRHDATRRPGPGPSWGVMRAVTVYRRAGPGRPPR